MTDVTAFDWATGAVALIGALAGMLALGLEFGRFLTERPRLVVEVRHAALNPGGAIVGPAMGLADEDFPVRAVAVVVQNRGRIPANIHAWWIELGSGIRCGMNRLPHNKPIPHRLEAFDEVTWFTELHTIHAAAHAAKHTLTVNVSSLGGSVATGDGRTFKAKRRLALPPASASPP